MSAHHEEAADAWDRCIEIDMKGVLDGIVAVYDQMIAQGRGHIANLPSIYGNQPVEGAAISGASKAAVDFLSESLPQESRGRIFTVNQPWGASIRDLTVRASGDRFLI